MLLISYWSIVLAFAMRSTEAGDPFGPFALGLALVPFVYLVLAFVSVHQKAPGAVLSGMALALVVGATLLFLAGNPVVAVVAGYASGGVVALRPEPGVLLRRRAGGAAMATLLVWLLLVVAEPVAIFFAPAIPLTAVGIADGVFAPSDPGE